MSVDIPTTVSHPFLVVWFVHCNENHLSLSTIFIRAFIGCLKINYQVCVFLVLAILYFLYSQIIFTRVHCTGGIARHKQFIVLPPYH